MPRATRSTEALQARGRRHHAADLSLERWGIVEAGARFGRVKTFPQAGLGQQETSDGVGQLFAGIAVDTLDDLHWPGPVAVWPWTPSGTWSPWEDPHPFWRLRLEGRLGPSVGRRATVQLDGLLGSRETTFPSTITSRIGGPMLVPGYRFEELKGPRPSPAP